MKTLLIKTIVSLAILIPVQNPDLSAFIKFVAKTHRIPANIKKDCNWQYAAIKVSTDKNNVINNCEFLNNVSDELKNSFAFLKGHHLATDLPIHQRPIVFFYTIENTNDDCKGPVNITTPTEATSKILVMIGTQFKKQPKTIFIYDPIVDAIYPTMK